MLDAGGGLGQISSGLAQRGHQILLCDLSAEMLRRAHQHAEAQGVSHNMKFRQIAVQQVGEHLDTPVDLVLFHAVLEWVAEPEKAHQALYDALRPSGVMSVMFFNRHSLVFRNLTLGNFGYLRVNMAKKNRRSVRCRQITRAILRMFTAGLPHVVSTLSSVPAYASSAIT